MTLTQNGTKQPESRPTTKTRSPLRIVPWMIAGGPAHALEYDAPVSLNGRITQTITNVIPCEEPLPGLFVEPLHVMAHHVERLIAGHHEAQAKVDGLVKQVDDAAAALAELHRENKRLTGQLEQAQRTNQKKEK